MHRVSRLPAAHKKSKNIIYVLKTAMDKTFVVIDARQDIWRGRQGHHHALAGMKMDGEAISRTWI